VPDIKSDEACSEQLSSVDENAKEEDEPSMEQEESSQSIEVPDADKRLGLDIPENEEPAVSASEENNAYNEPELAGDSLETSDSAASQTKEAPFIEEDTAMSPTNEADQEFMVMTNEELEQEGAVDDSDESFILDNAVASDAINSDASESLLAKPSDASEEGSEENQSSDGHSDALQENSETEVPAVQQKESAANNVNSDEDEPGTSEQEKKKPTLTEQEKKMSNLASIFNFGRK